MEGMYVVAKWHSLSFSCSLNRLLLEMRVYDDGKKSEIGKSHVTVPLMETTRERTSHCHRLIYLFTY